MAIAMRYGSNEYTRSGGASGGGGSGGGITMTPLWNNPSPTAAFAAQTVSLDLSGYDAVIILCVTDRTTSPLRHFMSNIMLVDGNNWSLWGVGGASTYTYNRMVDVLTTGLTFSTGYRNGSASTDRCVPITIYGIRGIT